jgi:hypothetical protein
MPSRTHAASSGPLNVLLLVRGGHQEERYFHDMFAKYRLDGEWFSPDPELIDYIQARRACMSPESN